MTNVTNDLPDARSTRLLSVERPARYFDMSKSTAYQAIKNDTFPVAVLRIAGRLRVRTADVNTFFGYADDGVTLLSPCLQAGLEFYSTPKRAPGRIGWQPSSSGRC